MKNIYLLLILFIIAAFSSEKAISAPNSKSIRESIVKELSDNQRLGRYELTIDVRQGAVTLLGEVASEKDKEIIGSVAQDANGVKSVNNYLRVWQGKLVGGDGLSSIIRKEMDKDPILRKESIGIDAKGDTVTLYGDVSSDEVSRRIEALTRSIDGVRHVQNKIAVNQPLTDDMLVRRVRETLSREEDIDLDGIGITSSAGVVTFRGSKSNHREIDRILSTTLMVDGVRDVKSELRIIETPYR